MSLFGEQIRGIHEQLGILDDAWEPPLPSYKIPASKAMALAHMMQLHGTEMLQMSRSIAKGNIRGARVKLRRIYHRMDAALRQLDQLDREAKRAR